MLNLEDAIKNAVERICRDRNEDDKIYIHVSDLAGEAIRQHAKILHDMRRANEEAQELAKAKAEGRLVVLPCKVGQRVWVIKDGKIDEGFVKWFDTGDPLNPQWTAAIQDVPRGPVFVPIESVYITREAAEKALEVKGV